LFCKDSKYSAISQHKSSQAKHNISGELDNESVPENGNHMFID